MHIRGTHTPNRNRFGDPYGVGGLAFGEMSPASRARTPRFAGRSAAGGDEAWNAMAGQKVNMSGGQVQASHRGDRQSVAGMWRQSTWHAHSVASSVGNLIYARQGPVP